MSGTRIVNRDGCVPSYCSSAFVLLRRDGRTSWKPRVFRHFSIGSAVWPRSSASPRSRLWKSEPPPMTLKGYPSECCDHYRLRHGRTASGSLPRDAGPARRCTGGRGFFFLAMGLTMSDLYVTGPASTACSISLRNRKPRNSGRRSFERNANSSR
jgi:hypothetical protein